jgi:hypothetical protein
MRIDVIAFLRDKKYQETYNSFLDLGITPSPYVRPEYSTIGHSSVNFASTDFGKSTPDVRTVAEQADQQVPNNQQFAPSADAVGEKAQTDQKVETIANGDGVGPLQGGDWETYKNVLGQRESGNNYASVNNIGFCGRWQFGAGALIDCGYVRAGSTTRGLRSPSCWTGKDGISSRQAWLSNSKVQDAAMLVFTRADYKALLRMKVITESSPKAVVAGYLAAAHLKGPGGARQLKNGQDNKDAYGTEASSYYKLLSGALGGTTHDPLTAAHTGEVPPDSATDAAAVSKNVQPDSASFNFPSSDAAPKYPHNKITEYEGGHFKEYDSTPGNERIQERHKSGTGYEIQADGTKREIVTKSRYTAVMGNDYILVNGTCQIIVNGDCGLRVNGNLNQSVGNDYNLMVGGNYNVTVGGNTNVGIAGSEHVNVVGDAAKTVSGFYNVGITGDYAVQAASVSAIARDGDITMGANHDITAAAKNDIKLNAVANINGVTGKSIALLAKGAVGVIGQTGALFASSAGKTTIHSPDEAVLHSDASVKVHGSAVFVTPKVDRADWADRGGTVILATALGGDPGAPPSQNPSGGAPGTQAAVDAGTKYSTEDSIDNAFDNFTPIDLSKTQAYAGGQEGELPGYQSGFNYESQGTSV